MKAVQIDYNYATNLDLIDIVLQIYCVTHLKKMLSKKEHICLREYVLNGYNDRTKKSLIITLFLSEKSPEKDKKNKITAFNNIFNTNFTNSSEIDKYIKENTINREQTLAVTEEYKKICYKKGSESLNAINYILKNKGLLVPHPTNLRMKIVSEELLKLKRTFVDDQNAILKCLVVNFKKPSI